MTERHQKVSSSLILNTAALVLFPLQILLSVFLLLRGHDEPGGGFIAGLVASGAFVLYLFAHGVDSARSVLRLSPWVLLGTGLLFALGSAAIGLLAGDTVFSAQRLWLSLGSETELKLSSVLLFDIGVYLTVLGAILTIIFGLAEAEG